MLKHDYTRFPVLLDSPGTVHFLPARLLCAPGPLSITSHSYIRCLTLQWAVLAQIVSYRHHFDQALNDKTGVIP